MHRTGARKMSNKNYFIKLNNSKNCFTQDVFFAVHTGFDLKEKKESVHRSSKKFKFYVYTMWSALTLSNNLYDMKVWVYSGTSQNCGSATLSSISATNVLENYFKSASNKTMEVLIT